MKMKMKKIDLSGVKEYLFQKGERIGLVVCGVLGVLLVVLGITKAIGSSTSYASLFSQEAKSLNGKIAGAVGDDGKPIPPPAVSDVWAEKNPHFVSTSWMANPDPPDNKSRNPDIYKINSDSMKIEFLRGGYFGNDVEKGDKVLVFRGPDKAGQPVKIVKAVRMVVFNAVFPMKAQWEEHRQKLNYPNMEELNKEKNDQPKPVGLVVLRCEVLGNDKYSEWMPLYSIKDGKTEVADHLKDFFREAYYDQENREMFANHLMRGLASPLPLLANIQYPKLDLKDITPAPVTTPPAVNPPQKGGTGPVNVQYNKVPFDDKNIDPINPGRLQGKIDYFEASGVPEGEIGGALLRTMKRPKNKSLSPLAPPVPTPQNPAPAGAGAAVVITEKLVRFVDVGVVPGKTYIYTVQVCMANPNYKQIEEVSYPELADIRELYSEFVDTPPITIPDEFYYYAVDQRPEGRILGGSDFDPAKAEPPLPYGLWNAPVQIHRWVGKFNDWTVADWAIAERILVRRGETIGKHELMVEVPVWNKARQAFEIGYEAQNNKDIKKRPPPGTHLAGLPINFIRDNPPPYLVDFEGGWKTGVKIGTATVKDESAVDLLILTSDGKLTVRNSRNDTEFDNPENPIGMDRHVRWEDWQRAVHRWRNVPGAGGPGGGGGAGGIVMPGKN